MFQMHDREYEFVIDVIVHIIENCSDIMYFVEVTRRMSVVQIHQEVARDSRYILDPSSRS